VHDPADAVDVHVADSLAGLPELAAAGVIADLGTGAGLPGLVIAAARPDATVWLVESVARKCAFLTEAAAAMGLGNTRVACARAEEWAEGLGACEAVTARALAALPVLVEYAAPLLREGGVLVAWKGRVDAEEEADGAAAAEAVGLRFERVLPVEPFPGSEHRTLWVYRKLLPTPPRFPRRPGVAAKRPIRRSRR